MNFFWSPSPTKRSTKTRDENSKNSAFLTIETATNKRAECWLSGNHANHGNDENH